MAFDDLTYHLDPNPSEPGDLVDFIIDVMDDDGLTFVSYDVEWGDGDIDSFGTPPGTGTIGSHAYAAAGGYSVSLKVLTTEPAYRYIASLVATVADPEPEPDPDPVGPGVGDCPSFILETRATSVTFDCETADPLYGLAWVWQDVPGWWEPPTPDRDFIDGLGAPVAAVPTAARWQPREITLQATAICGGSEGLLDALDTLTALSDMLGVPGTLTSTEVVPKRISVRLADRPTFEVLGEAQYLQVTIPMIAHSPLRIVVADDSLVV